MEHNEADVQAFKRILTGMMNPNEDDKLLTTFLFNCYKEGVSETDMVKAFTELLAEAREEERKAKAEAARKAEEETKKLHAARIHNLAFEAAEGMYWLLKESNNLLPLPHEVTDEDIIDHLAEIFYAFATSPNGGKNQGVCFYKRDNILHIKFLEDCKEGEVEHTSAETKSEAAAPDATKRRELEEALKASKQHESDADFVRNVIKMHDLEKSLELWKHLNGL